jgi:hypothetical protein
LFSNSVTKLPMQGALVVYFFYKKMLILRNGYMAI